MSINLSNFVEIKLNPHLQTSSNGSREVAVLINTYTPVTGEFDRDMIYNSLSNLGVWKTATESSTAAKGNYQEVSTGKYIIYNGNKWISTSLLTSNPKYSPVGFTLLRLENTTYYWCPVTAISELSGTSVSIYKYMKIFFDNGGKSLHLVIPSAITATGVLNAIKALPSTEIVVAMAKPSAVTFTLREIADSYTEEGIKQKIFVDRLAVPAAGSLPEYEEEKSFYVSKCGDEGIEASVLAYLTAINIDQTDSCKDYAFTSESFASELGGTYVTDRNDLVESIIENNSNVDGYIAGSNRNIGGNDSAGYTLINQFMLIVLYQTLTDRLLAILASKIKYNTVGINKVINGIAQEMNRYLKNGYISTSKTWNDGNLYYRDMLIIGNNTPLTTGYSLSILPYSEEDLLQHRFPSIYILLADAYHIRKIVIEGEVF